MGKGEMQGMNAVQMATGVALGGLLALGVGVCLAFDRALEVLTARYRQRRRPHGLS